MTPAKTTKKAKSPKGTKDEPRRSVGASCRAFENGASAAGASGVHPGAARTPAWDLEFALGYPHAVALDASDDDSDEALRAEVARCSGGTHARPAALAVRLTRLLMFGIFDDGVGGTLLEHEGKEVAPPGPLEAAEVATLIEAALDAPYGVQVNFLHAVLLLEAVVGPDALLRAVAAALAKRSSEALRASGNAAAPSLAHWVGFGLLRARPATAAAARVLLAKRLAALRKEDPVLRGAAEALALALDPATQLATMKAELDGEPLDPFDALHAVGETDLVAQIVVKAPKDAWVPLYARLAFLGGEPVLQHYLKRLPKVREADAQRDLLREFQRLASPTARKLVQALATASKVKKEAAAVLAAWPG